MWTGAVMREDDLLRQFPGLSSASLSAYHWSLQIKITGSWVRAVRRLVRGFPPSFANVAFVKFVVCGQALLCRRVTFFDSFPGIFFPNRLVHIAMKQVTVILSLTATPCGKKS
jgi:hypothetical protein